ncbi:MAG: sigma-70 family RNA polymerase sigma factor [Rhodothermales bacterium]
MYVKSDREDRDRIDADDLSLVRRTVRGDRGAFGALVDRYQKPIYNVALRIVKNPEDAEDIAQTVFMKAYQKLDGFDERYRFFSWIYRIAINESLNFSTRRRSFEALEPSMQSAVDSPEEETIKLDKEERVGDAILELEPEDRAIVILKHFQGFSYAEIGFILNIPEKTVKSRLYTARQRLKDVLTRMGYFNK